MLARRTELWREACAGESDWFEATRGSLYKSDVGPDALRHSGEALRSLWNHLSATAPAALGKGEIA
jgi:hypothetical protein